jgi:hypothetical protein
MHPALQYDMMQVKRQDLMQSAARQRIAAEARTAGLPRRDHTAAAPRRRVLHLVWRLLPS